jgi:hypothetical protein
VHDGRAQKSSVRTAIRSATCPSRHIFAPKFDRECIGGDTTISLSWAARLEVYPKSDRLDMNGYLGHIQRPDANGHRVTVCDRAVEKCACTRPSYSTHSDRAICEDANATKYAPRIRLDEPCMVALRGCSLLPRPVWHVDASSEVRQYWRRGIASTVCAMLMAMPRLPSDHRPPLPMKLMLLPSNKHATPLGFLWRIGARARLPHDLLHTNPSRRTSSAISPPPTNPGADPWPVLLDGEAVEAAGAVAVVVSGTAVLEQHHPTARCRLRR